MIRCEIHEAKTPNREKRFDIKRDSSIPTISGRSVCLAFTFSISDIFKGICLRQAYIPSLDSHCLSLTTTVSLSPRDHLSPPSSQYSMKSGDAFVYWVLSKPAFLTLYISRLSFPHRSTFSSSLAPSPFFISYLQTMLVSISIHCARHAQRKTSLLKSCAATTQVI